MYRCATIHKSADAGLVSCPVGGRGAGFTGILGLGSEGWVFSRWWQPTLYGGDGMGPYLACHDVDLRQIKSLSLFKKNSYEATAG